MSRASISRLCSSCLVNSCTCSLAHSIVSTFFPTKGTEKGNQEKRGNRWDGRSCLGTNSSRSPLQGASGSLADFFSLLVIFPALFCFLFLLRDRKSTRLNSSHQIISYAVFCLKKKKKKEYHRSHTIDG